MGERCVTTSVNAARNEFSVEVARNATLVAEAFRLRHQVYCIENTYEAGRNGLEQDEFDSNARHIVLRRRSTAEVVGTVRVVLPGRTLPIHGVCTPASLHSLPWHKTGEISRFSLSKARRVGSGEAGGMMRLGLMQGILRVSQEAGLTHWCAVMERSLLRLLQTTAIYFQPIGPLVEFHGPRQPAIGRIDTILDRMRREAGPIFDYVTEDGTLWPVRVHRLAA